MFLPPASITNHGYLAQLLTQQFLRNSFFKNFPEKFDFGFRALDFGLCTLEFRLWTFGKFSEFQLWTLDLGFWTFQIEKNLAFGFKELREMSLDWRDYENRYTKSI